MHSRRPSNLALVARADVEVCASGSGEGPAAASGPAEDAPRSHPADLPPAEPHFRAALSRLERATAALVQGLEAELANYLAGCPQDERKDRPLYYSARFALSGPRRQCEELAKLHAYASGRELLGNFGLLRDIFSLFPRNHHFRPFLSDLLRSEFPAACARLRADCEGKIVIFHTTCRDRLALAEASARSFGELGDRYHHVILLGQRKVTEERFTDLGFEYDGRVLTVPKNDNYETAHAKIFYGYTLLDLLADPLFVMKVDDDILLNDRAQFEGMIDMLAQRGADCAGRIVGSARHQDQWHGWHISKCQDEAIEARGYQFPLPRL